MDRRRRASWPPARAHRSALTAAAQGPSPVAGGAKRALPRLGHGASPEPRRGDTSPRTPRGSLAVWCTTPQGDCRCSRTETRARSLLTRCPAERGSGSAVSAAVGASPKPLDAVLRCRKDGRKKVAQASRLCFPFPRGGRGQPRTPPGRHVSPGPSCRLRRTGLPLGAILLIALPVSNRIEFVLRQHVKEPQTTLPGWDRRETRKPTTFMMRTKFAGIIVVCGGNTRALGRPLTPVQSRYLDALGISHAECLRPPGGLT